MRRMEMMVVGFEIEREGMHGWIRVGQVKNQAMVKLAMCNHWKKKKMMMMMKQKRLRQALLHIHNSKLQSMTLKRMKKEKGKKEKGKNEKRKKGKKEKRKK